MRFVLNKFKVLFISIGIEIIKYVFLNYIIYKSLKFCIFVK